MNQYKQLNEALRDLAALRRKSRIERTVVKELDGEGDQGESGLSYEVCSTPIEGLFVKLTINTDSYGDNEFVAGVEFVQPIQKTVTNYEPIK